MNTVLILIFATFGFIPLICSQTFVSPDPDPIKFFSNSNTPTITFNLVNFTGTSTPILTCNFVNTNALGYSNAIFQAISNSGTNPIIYTVPLSLLTVGRVRDFICGFSLQPGIKSLTKYLSIRPAIQAFVCNTVNATPDQTFNVPITFSDPLTSDIVISCSSSIITPPINFNVASGTVSTTLSFTYPILTSNTSPDPFTCTFTLITPSNFSFQVTIQQPSISFLNTNIITNSPIIQLTLLSNYNPTSDVGFNCTIVLPSSVTCSAVSNTSIGWTLSTNQVTLKANAGQAVQFTMSRTSLLRNTSEQYSVVCCGSSLIPSYTNITIPNLSTEYAAIPTGAETSYADLRYYPLSNCPCDLTVAVCDSNCCCDPFCNCSSNVVAINGPYGGFFNDILDRSCYYPYTLTKSSYKVLMCVANESPNILGDYYPMQSIVNDVNIFTSFLSTQLRSNVFQLRTIPSSSISQLSSMYLPITTNYLSSFALSQYLYLPKQALDSSKCDLQNPVTFLQEYQSVCTYLVTSANCATLTDPRLNAFFYLSSTTLLQTNCVNNFGISSVQGNIPVFSFYNCGLLGGQFTTCSWDNGYALPPSPVFSGSTCQNVVNTVSYTVYYNSSAISYISAYIELTNMSINTNLNQRFSVSFVMTTATREQSAFQSFSSLQVSSSTTFSTVSGLYGYDDGKPVLTVNDVSSTVFTPIYSLPTSPTGVCTNTLGSPVLFRQDTYTECKFDISSHNSCSLKRGAIKKYLDSLFSNSYVAIYGNPSTSASDYVQLYPPAFSPTDSVSATGIANQNLSIPANEMKTACFNIITGVVTTVFYSRQGRAQNQYINNIIGVTKSYLYSSLSNFTAFGTSNNNNNSITITSSVEFVLRSAGISGAQSLDNVPQAVCYFDICFNELFYPWMYNYEGKQGFYEEAFGLFLLGLAIFLLATTYPWW